MIRELGSRGNLRLAQDDQRRFPGLLVPGDALATLVESLEEEAPDSHALATAKDWLSAYEEMMTVRGLPLPYRR